MKTELLSVIAQSTVNVLLVAAPCTAAEPYYQLGRERKRLTIPTERPPIAGEVSANFCRKKLPHGQRGGSPTAVFSVF
jgi:hypothetical protein